MDDLLSMMETFGDNRLLATGVLENSEILPWSDPTGHSYAEMLDGLCYADCANGFIASLGLAGVPKLQGVSRIGSRQLMFPTATFGKEAQVRKNHNLLRNNAKLRNNFELLELYMDPSMQTSNVLFGRTLPELRARFVGFHKLLNISYKKNSFGHYQSEPDIDMFLDYTGNGVGHLTRFRELMQREMGREEADIRKITTEKSRDDYVKGRKKKKAAVDFWGQKIEAPLSVYSVDKRPELYYRYNEGFTNAVRRRVYLERILVP